MLTSEELKDALLNRKRVRIITTKTTSELNYVSYVTAIIYRRSDNGIRVTAEISSASGNSVSYVVPEDLYPFEETI